MDPHAHVATRICLLPGEPGRIFSGSVSFDFCLEARLFLMEVSDLVGVLLLRLWVGWMLVDVCDVGRRIPRDRIRHTGQL